MEPDKAAMPALEWKGMYSYKEISVLLSDILKTMLGDRCDA